VCVNRLKHFVGLSFHTFTFKRLSSFITEQKTGEFQLINYLEINKWILRYGKEGVMEGVPRLELEHHQLEVDFSTEENQGLSRESSEPELDANNAAGAGAAPTMFPLRADSPRVIRRNLHSSDSPKKSIVSILLREFRVACVLVETLILFGIYSIIYATVSFLQYGTNKFNPFYAAQENENGNLRRGPLQHQNPIQVAGNHAPNFPQHLPFIISNRKAQRG